ncbi:MAG TPA: GntR family transcriptional regulator, partial [Chloroflexota bacterium]|nr:GntR family transcriptional regulator [Chloroflexota bacterium]
EELAEQLRVSRMPVREAIQRLQVEGLVDMIPHRGATVAMATREQLGQVFAVRSVIEGLSAREAASRITGEEIDRLESLYREMEGVVANSDTDGQLCKNREMHSILWEITGNPLLQSIARNLFDASERYRRQLMLQPRIAKEALEEHRAILDAISDRDPDRAERLTREHIERTGRLMASYTRPISDGGNELDSQ